MRKSILYTAICAALLLSCQMKDKGTDIDLSGYTTFKVDMEEISFGSLPEDRVWQEGDMIGVFGSEQGENEGFYLKTSSEGETIAEFYGPLVKGNLIRAYFPYDKGLKAGVDGIPCTLSPVQAYEPQKNSVDFFTDCSGTAFAVLDGTGEFHFRYPFGILEITMALDTPVDMTGASLSGKSPVSGMFEIDEQGTPVPTDVSQNVITLDFDGAVVPSEDSGEPAVLRFVLPPAYYFAGDLSLEVNVQDGQDFIVLLEDVAVERVDCSDFTVSTTTVTLSDIPGLEVENGYLENEQ